MITLKRVMYHVDEATTKEGALVKDYRYITVREICSYFYDEDIDYYTKVNRIRSQIYKHTNLFLIKKIEGVNSYRLSSEGYKYLNKFKDNFNPITEKIEVF